MINFLEGFWCDCPSDAPGFQSVRIAPSLGNLKEASGTIPHPLGKISVAYKTNEKRQLVKRIVLPSATTGVFVWKEKEYRLQSGEQTLRVNLTK
ncbi:alpha-L-rhamnosidase C-terminal domain-containing protein [Parabacteroides gordonii]|jgi:alpha-L-rhamnosidase|uniref:alpha-L-rhamnosidase C-terminal domain-containing protein n=1 Tax=Parabacteroides gordonii TaxID=574930 RepID=UPI00241CEB4A|nr:alpha-L-rhamnosidase C-terminal domain-containing protein [Parabacteroides gordonii]